MDDIPGNAAFHEDYFSIQVGNSLSFVGITGYRNVFKILLPFSSHDGEGTFLANALFENLTIFNNISYLFCCISIIKEICGGHYFNIS
jgi:hypothetical protein